MIRMGKKGRLSVVVAVMAALCLAAFCFPGTAWAGKPTISGLLKNFNPGGGRLQIQRDDGTIKQVVLRPGTQYVMQGEPVPPNSFRLNMRVVVRICGSLGDNPLEGDLVTDISSSRFVVSRKASAPGSTPVGGFASVGGASGIASGLNSTITPSVVGPVGLGGNFPGSLTNPGVANPVNSAYPANPTAGNIEAATRTPNIPNTMGNVGGGQYPGGVMPAGNNSTAGSYGNQYGTAGGYGNPYGSALGNSGPSMAQMINGSDDDDSDSSFMSGLGGGSNSSSGPLGMNVVQFTGRVMAVDSANRVISAVPQGAMQPVQIQVHPQVRVTSNGQPVDISAVRPGMGIVVQGMSNSVGMIEARVVQLTP